MMTVTTQLRSGAFEWCVTSILCFFTADIVVQFYLSLESGVVMTPSSKGLSVEETEQALLEKLTDTYPSNTSADDDSTGTDDLAVGKVIGLEYSDKEDNIEEDVTVCSVPSSSAMFTWDNVTKYVGPREQYVDNCGPRMKPKMKLTMLKCSKFFYWN
jgi:hypothetical protein